MNGRTFAVALLLGLTVLARPGAVRADSPFSEIVVFGDSISDTGNAFLATNGVAAPPPYFDGNFSNGPVWVEVLADELGLAAPRPSEADGANYAYGGAEAGDGLSFFGTPNVRMQIDAFLDDRDGLIGDELVVVFAGANEFGGNPPFSPAVAAQNLEEDISVLAAAGGKTFLVPNLYPLGQAPRFRGAEFELYLDNMAGQLNFLLEPKLQSLQEELGIRVIRFDLAQVVETMLLSPADFELTNVIEPACPGCRIGFPNPDAADTIVSKPDEYMWWDFVHMSRAAHAVIGEAAAAQVNSSAVAAAAVPEPASAVLLIVTATGMLLWRDRGWRSRFKTRLRVRAFK